MLFLGFNLYAWITIITVLGMFTILLFTKLRSDLVYDQETAVKYSQFRKHFDDAFLPATRYDSIG